MYLIFRPKDLDVLRNVGREIANRPRSQNRVLILLFEKKSHLEKRDISYELSERCDQFGFEIDVYSQISLE